MIEIELHLLSVFALENSGLLVVVVAGEALVGGTVGEEGVSLPVRIEMDGVFGVVSRGERGLFAFLNRRNLLFDAALLQVLNRQLFTLRISLLHFGILEDALPEELERERKNAQSEAANLINFSNLFRVESHFDVG